MNVSLSVLMLALCRSLTVKKFVYVFTNAARVKLRHVAAERVAQLQWVSLKAYWLRM
jgi:hypothetical protein